VLCCYARPRRAVCIREVQNSIKESVRQLIIDKIGKFDLGAFFTILDSEIRGKNGSLIIFKGMQSYNSENIKSLEGYDIAWVEEAQNLSDTSLRLLRPTIRKPGSELWFSWNPRYETDAVDRFFRGGAHRKDAVVVAVNWNDNPWFPDVLRQEMQSSQQKEATRSSRVAELLTAMRESIARKDIAGADRAFNEASRIDVLDPALDQARVELAQAHDAAREKKN